MIKYDYFNWFTIVLKNIFSRKNKSPQKLITLWTCLFLSLDFFMSRYVQHKSPKVAYFDPPPTPLTPRRIDLWPLEGIRETPPEVQGSSSCQRGSVCFPDCFMMETRRDNIYLSLKIEEVTSCGGGGSTGWLTNTALPSHLLLRVTIIS